MTETIYHLNLCTVQRAKGQSATGKYAYNAGERVKDLQLEKNYNYCYKKSGVVAMKTYLPPGVTTNLSQAFFWNMVEARERHPRAWVAREYKGALPASLSERGRLNIMVEFCQFLAAELHTLVLGCIHRPGRGDNRNHHCHVLFPTRTFDGQVLGKKHRHLDIKKTSTQFVVKCRAKFAAIINAELKKENKDEFVDHRSYEERGIDKLPGKHLGPKRWSQREKIRKEIADAEKVLRGIEAQELAVLSSVELESATMYLHRCVQNPDHPCPDFFSLNADGCLQFASSFALRVEKTKQAKVTKPDVIRDFALHEFLSAHALAQEHLDGEREQKRQKSKKPGKEM